MAPRPDLSLPLFVYGTLRDPITLARVIGRMVGASESLKAVAPGHRAAFYPGRSYPILLAAPARQAPGLIIQGLTPNDLARLDAFEGDEYRRGTVTVLLGSEDAAAETYWPTAAIEATAPDWDFEAWLGNPHRASA